MRIRQISTAALAATLAVAAGAGCSSSSSSKASPQPAAVTATSTPAPTRTLAEQAAYDDKLSTFATVLNVSGVLDTIGRHGPYTVFAPDNNAFARVRHAAFVALLARAGKQRLAKLLTGHVVKGLVLSQKLAPRRLKTLNGGTLTIAKSGNGFVITDTRGHRASIELPPVVASNGVIYKVDALLGNA